MRCQVHRIAAAHQLLPPSSAVNRGLFGALDVAPWFHNGVHSPHPPRPWQAQRIHSRYRYRRPGPQAQILGNADGQESRRRRRGCARAGGGRRDLAVELAAGLRVLFSNYSDRDGGAITASLDQMGVKYKFSDGGNAILVPAEQVPSMRLKLAAQGLPRAGNVGFELLENQKLGTSQFVEQVNYQRSLEGELARSIQALAAVSSARVHLALPKPSVFVREQQKPTASVLLNLQPGRTLDQAQVSAIVHLVASSVPELPASNVTVVDQNGNLLSDTANKAGKQLDPNQLKYVERCSRTSSSRSNRSSPRWSARPMCAPKRPPTSTSPRSIPPPNCTSRIRRRNRRRSAASRPPSRPAPARAIRRACRARCRTSRRAWRPRRSKAAPRRPSSRAPAPARPARTRPPTTKSTRPCATSRSRWAASSA
jgi:type III secretory pathway lipoprotein EscJ